MSELTNKIQMAQVEAAEDAVVASLRAKGLMPPDPKREHERLRSAVVEAALVDRRAEESKYGDNRDIDNLIATRRAFRLAVTELVEFEASHTAEQKDE